MSHIDEWIELEYIDGADRYTSEFCYVHKLAVVAVLPSTGSFFGSFILMANGNQFRVKETAKEVMGKLANHD